MLVGAPPLVDFLVYVTGCVGVEDLDLPHPHSAMTGKQESSSKLNPRYTCSTKNASLPKPLHYVEHFFDDLLWRFGHAVPPFLLF